MLLFNQGGDVMNTAKTGSFISQLRKEKGLTQKQLADAIGVTDKAVSRWETGTTCPDIFALPALAELFGITVDGLLGVDEKEKQKEIRSIISVAEEKLDKGIIDEPILKLREALNKYPNNKVIQKKISIKKNILLLHFNMNLQQKLNIKHLLM